jgi:hypothetical protein
MIGLIFDCRDKVQNSAEIGAVAETGSRSRQYCAGTVAAKNVRERDLCATDPLMKTEVVAIERRQP